jgi:hypothetical protein
MHAGGECYVLLAYNVLVAAFGHYTMTKLCPSPMQNRLAVGEITIWSNLFDRIDRGLARGDERFPPVEGRPVVGACANRRVNSSAPPAF